MILQGLSSLMLMMAAFKMLVWELGLQSETSVVQWFGDLDLGF
jgi:hypothetical protein